MTSVHGEHCGARTFPMTCRHCGHDVFYFSCNCGSQVFFDSLGDDWPVHDCLSLLDKLRALERRIGKTEVERAMAARMMQVGWRRAHGLDGAYSRRVRRIHQERGPVPSANEILRKVPQRARNIVDIGTLREIVDIDDPWRSLGIGRTSIEASQLNGSLPRWPMCKVTVHVGDLADDDVHSYTALCSTTELGSIPRHTLVRFELAGRPLIGRDGVWIVLWMRPVQ